MNYKLELTPIQAGWLESVLCTLEEANRKYLQDEPENGGLQTESAIIGQLLQMLGDV